MCPLGRARLQKCAASVPEAMAIAIEEHWGLGLGPQPRQPNRGKCLRWYFTVSKCG